MCGCLVHAKRKFHEAWKVNESNTDVKQGEAYIQKLFAIEAKADKLNLTVEERFQLRNTESKAVLDEFYRWIDSVSTRTLPQSLLGKAITYAQNQKQYLTNFLKDGRIQLSNNLKPMYYLEYVFEQIQLNKNLQIEYLLPWSEKILDFCKNNK